MTDGPRTLIYDIETSPNLAYIWAKWQQNAIAFEQEWQILSVAWKWLGEKGPIQACWMEGDDSDERVVEQLHNLFDEADIVVAHNGDKFDQKKSRARMAYHHMLPPSPFKSVDTLAVAKRHFAFTSNRLDDLCKYLDIGGKIETGGFDTWWGCLRDDPKAWAKLVRYNKHDVVILERLYLELLPWMDRHPNVALYTDTPDTCPKCGVVGQMIRRGWHHYTVTKRPRFQCKACGGYCQGRTVKRSEATYQ
jgi:hypothetical protein